MRGFPTVSWLGTGSSAIKSGGFQLHVVYTTYYFNLTVYSCLIVCIICVLLQLVIIHKRFMELSIYKFMSICMAVILPKSVILLEIVIES